MKIRDASDDTIHVASKRGATPNRHGYAAQLWLLALVHGRWARASCSIPSFGLRRCNIPGFGWIDRPVGTVFVDAHETAEPAGRVDQAIRGRIGTSC